MPSGETKSSSSSLSEEIEDYLRVLQQGLEKINATFDKTSSWDGGTVDDISDEVFIESIESQFSTWLSWFYNTIVYLLIINVFFFTSIFDPFFQPLAIILAILFPFYLWWAFLNSIPEITINNEIIFSRKNLTLRRQFQLGRTMFTYFSKEMIKNTPWGTFFLSIAMICFITVVTLSYL